jgi:hypothetical protein
VGAARRGAADKPGSPDHCGSAAGGPELGPSGSLTFEPVSSLVALVGCASLCCSGADLGITGGTRRTGRKLPGPARDVGISRRSGRTRSGLGSTTARAARRGTGSFMGSSGAVCRAAACAPISSSIVGSARRTCASVGRAAGCSRPSGSPGSRLRTVVGSAACSGAAEARRPAGDIVEPARSVMGPAEARHAGGTLSARLE